MSTSGSSQDKKKEETDIDQISTRLNDQLIVDCKDQAQGTKVLNALQKKWYEHISYKRPSDSSKKKCQTAVRIASWNLTDFSLKYTDDTKIDIVCETIDYHEFDIVALQEVGETKCCFKDNKFDTKAAITKLHEKLLQKKRGWKICHTESPIGKAYRSLPVYGVFLYNSDKVTKESERVVIEDQPIFVRSPVTCEFSTTTTVLSLTSFHLKSAHDKPGIKHNETELKKLRCFATPSEEKHIILLGDFNCYVGKEEYKLTQLNSKGYCNLLQEKQYTNTSDENPKSYDGIIVENCFKDMPYGVADMVLKGDIEETDISTHKPIWADILPLKDQTSRN